MEIDGDVVERKHPVLSRMRASIMVNFDSSRSQEVFAFHVAGTSTSSIPVKATATDPPDK